MVPALDDATDHVGSRRPHQQGQLVEVGVDRFARHPGEHHTDEHDALAEGAFDQRHWSGTTAVSARLSSASASSSS